MCRLLLLFCLFGYRSFKAVEARTLRVVLSGFYDMASVVARTFLEFDDQRVCRDTWRVVAVIVGRRYERQQQSTKNRVIFSPASHALSAATPQKLCRVLPLLPSSHITGVKCLLLDKHCQIPGWCTNVWFKVTRDEG